MLQRFAQHRQNIFDVSAAGDFGHYAPILGMQINLARDDVRQHPPAIFNDVMAMRSAKTAMQLQTGKDALSMWLVANYKREVQLADGKDATMDGQEKATLDPSVDRAAANSGRGQLAAGDTAALSFAHFFPRIRAAGYGARCGFRLPRRSTSPAS